MKRAGFIDLQMKRAGSRASAGAFKASDCSFSLHIFNKSAEGYIFEKTLVYDLDNSSSLHDIASGIGEFYLGIPFDLIDFRIINLPFSDRDKLKKVLPFELESLVLDGADSVVFDSVPISGQIDAFDILVPYVKKTIIGELLSRLSTIGIDPRVITSLELAGILKGDRDEIPLRLMNAGALDADMRIQVAAGEILSPVINLRSGLFSYTKDKEKAGRALKLTFILAIVLAMVIHSDLAFRIIAKKGEASSIKTGLRNMYAGIFPNDKRVTDELYQMKSHMKEIREKGEAMLGVNQLRFLLNMSQKTQGIVYNEINIDRRLVTLKGNAASMDDISRMKTTLSEMLTEVAVSDIKLSPEGKRSFTVAAKTRE